VTRLALRRRQPVLGVCSFADGVALHLQIDANELPHLRVVVDQQDERAAGGLARTRPVEKSLQVASLVAAMATRRVESRHPPEVGPLPDRALSNPEELRGLPEREPVALARGCTP